MNFGPPLAQPFAEFKSFCFVIWTVLRWDEKRLILQVCVGAWMCCFCCSAGNSGERQVLHTLEYLDIKKNSCQNVNSLGVSSHASWRLGASISWKASVLGCLVTGSMWKQILFFFKLLFELLRSACRSAWKWTNTTVLISLLYIFVCMLTCLKGCTWWGVVYTPKKKSMKDSWEWEQHVLQW